MTLQGSVKASASAMAGATAAAQGEAGATLATITALEASEQKLADVIAVKNNATAASNQLHAALNTEMASLIEEEAKLKAASGSGYKSCYSIAGSTNCNTSRHYFNRSMGGWVGNSGSRGRGCSWEAWRVRTFI